MKLIKGLFWFIFFIVFVAITLVTIWNFVNITLPILVAGAGTTDIVSVILYFFATLFGA